MHCTGPGTGGTVERNIGRHDGAERVHSAGLQRRPRRLSAFERIHAGRRRKSKGIASNGLGARRRVHLG